MRQPPRPFISYAREDAPAAIQLYGDLRAMGAQPWLDAIELLPGQDWDLAIRDALSTATHFVALMSRRSVNKRGYVQKELKQALDVCKEFPAGDIFLIPVRLEPVEPRVPELRDLQWADLFTDRSSALQKIAKSLGLTAIKPVPTRTIDRTTRLARATRANQIDAAWQWIGIAVNDLLPSYSELEPRLAAAQIRPVYLFSARGAKQPPPVYSVIVAHSKVGMTVLRHVSEVVGEVGNWYLQIWDDHIPENRVAVGAYGYGGAPAARIDKALLAQMKNRAFTMSKLRKWIAMRGSVLDADYRPKD